MNISTNKK